MGTNEWKHAPSLQAINNDTTKFHEIMDASNTYKLIKIADIESIEMIDC